MKTIKLIDGREAYIRVFNLILKGVFSDGEIVGPVTLFNTIAANEEIIAELKAKNERMHEALHFIGTDGNGGTTALIAAQAIGLTE